MQKKEFIPYGKQSISQEDIEAVVNVLKSDVMTRGPCVEHFEKAFADYCGAKFAVAFPNGTAALMAAGNAAEFSPFDRVITTPNTFIATVVPAVQAGSTLVFVDIDRKTGNLDLNQVKYNLETPPSRGRHIVIPVHFSGIPVDMKELDRQINDPDVLVIEDAAHAVGSCYPDGSRVGSCRYSAMTIFSFHPVKTMTTGEGGMVTTNDLELAESLRRFRNNGIVRGGASWNYDVVEVTGNYNVTDIQAALGLSQLQRIESFIIKRRLLVDKYRELLEVMPGIRFFESPCHEATAYHLFVVQIDFAQFETTREEVMARLADNGIGSQVHYIPIYRHSVIRQKCGDIAEFFPHMQGYFADCLSLPLYYDLKVSDVESVVSVLKSCLLAEKR